MAFSSLTKSKRFQPMMSYSEGRISSNWKKDFISVKGKMTLTRVSVHINALSYGIIHITTDGRKLSFPATKTGLNTTGSGRGVVTLITRVLVENELLIEVENTSSQDNYCQVAIEYSPW